MSHRIVPQFVPVNHRYQCKVCHCWVYYSEWNGKWWHQNTNRNAEAGE